MTLHSHSLSLVNEIVFASAKVRIKNQSAKRKRQNFHFDANFTLKVWWIQKKDVTWAVKIFCNPFIYIYKFKEKTFTNFL